MVPLSDVVSRYITVHSIRNMVVQQVCSMAIGISVSVTSSSSSLSLVHSIF